MDIHKSNLDLGYKVLEINNSDIFTNRVFELDADKRVGRIKDYLIIPTELVPESTKATNYENAVELDSLFTIYVLEK